MPAAVAGGHQQGDFCKDVREQERDQRAAHQQSNAEAEELRTHIDAEGIAHLGENLFQAGLFLLAQEQTAEQHAHQHIGVGADLTAPGDQIQELRPKQQSQYPGHEGGGDVEHLQELDLGPHKLSDHQQQGHKTEIRQKRHIIVFHGRDSPLLVSLASRG